MLVSHWPGHPLGTLHLVVLVGFCWPGHQFEGQKKRLAISMVLSGATRAFGPHTFSFARSPIEACDCFCCKGMQGGWWLQWFCYRSYAKYLCCSVTTQSCWHCAGLKVFEFHGDVYWGQRNLRTSRFFHKHFDFPESTSAVLVQGHRAVVVGLAPKFMDLALFQAFRFLSACFVLVVGGNVFVAKAVGAENLPAVGGIWPLDPQRHFCRV